MDQTWQTDQATEIAARSINFSTNAKAPLYAGRISLTADGKLRPCLFSDREIDVRSALRERGEDGVYECFLKALDLKPDEHHDKIGTERKMSQIGG